MNQSKAELRQKFKDIRLAMARRDVEARSQIICQKLHANIDWANIKTLLVYEPITKLNEVELADFLSGLASRQPEISVDTMPAAPAQPLPNKHYDAILVPVLAFDKDNFRLGWGGGFYDRLLASQPEALKIGLGFSSGWAANGLPHEPHDVPLDKIITEA